MRTLSRWASALFLLTSAPGCPASDPAPSVTPSEADPSSPASEPTSDPLSVLDDLERKIGERSDTAADRKAAHALVASLPDDGSAGYALARAALAGRLAENRGAKAGKLVTEAETFARKALERDPEFRDFAATRLLGTLYVLAPPRLVEHGDSEVGLEMLEELVDRLPDDPRARLRLAEAYIALGDPEPAGEHLCRARAAREQLPRDEQRLLGKLVADFGGEAALTCAS